MDSFHDKYRIYIYMIFHCATYKKRKVTIFVITQNNNGLCSINNNIIKESVRTDIYYFHFHDNYY